MPDQLAQRLAGDGADVLLGLRDRPPVERPVSGIVHPRRDLVDQNFRAAIPLHHEYLNRDHTDVFQRVGDLSRYPASPKDGQGIAQAKRTERDRFHPNR
jgi:hypothetical protein